MLETLLFLKQNLELGKKYKAETIYKRLIEIGKLDSNTTFAGFVLFCYVHTVLETSWENETPFIYRKD
jgi:hypothetical protein